VIPWLRVRQSVERFLGEDRAEFPEVNGYAFRGDGAVC
jgi:hypothetical protein